MDMDRMECLRLALGSRVDAKPLTTSEAADAIAVADQLYAWACQGEAGEAKPVTIEGVMMTPGAGDYMGLDG